MEKTNIRVIFDIFADVFDTDIVTNQLKVSPTIVRKKGEPIRNTGRKILDTSWSYSTNVVESLFLDEEIEKIVNLFSPKMDMLCELKKKYGLEFRIDVVAVIEDDRPPSMLINAEAVQFAAKLGASIDIDTYVN